MNLIEQLGGYEKAKDHRDYLIDFGNEFNRPNKYEVNKINNALLEYRSKHNIFEVGDKVIKTHPKNTILWPVLGVYKNGGVWLDYKGFCWKPPSVRHATDEEIKAGKRLQVNQ